MATFIPEVRVQACRSCTSFTPGNEGAGTVVAVGEGVDPVRRGLGLGHDVAGLPADHAPKPRSDGYLGGHLHLYGSEY